MCVIQLIQHSFSFYFSNNVLLNKNTQNLSRKNFTPYELTTVNELQLIENQTTKYKIEGPIAPPGGANCLFLLIIHRLDNTIDNNNSQYGSHFRGSKEIHI